MGKDDTAPIDLTTGRPRALRRREVVREATPDPDQTPDPDAPKGKHDRSGSALVRSVVDTVLTTAKNPNPSEADLRKLNTEVTALAMLAEKGLGMLSAASSGGGGRSPFVVVLAVVFAAFGLNFGLDVFDTGAGQAQAQIIAEAKVQSERNAEDVNELRKRQDESERVAAERDRAVRRNIGLTVRWLGDEQERSCRNSQAIAEGLNLLLKRERRDDEFEPIRINCDASKLIPPELDVLRATVRDDLDR